MDGPCAWGTCPFAEAKGRPAVGTTTTIARSLWPEQGARCYPRPLAQMLLGAERCLASS